MPTFADRRQAGRVLAKRLSKYRTNEDVVVLGLPRGGVPVAWEVARELGAPLDVFLVRRLGVPGHEELAMGAVGPEDTEWVWQDVVEAFGVGAEELEAAVGRERQELVRRERGYRGGVAPRRLEGRIAILVDDGLATGAALRIVASAARAQKPARVVIGVPISAPSTSRELGPEVDEFVCAITPEPFVAVGAWYRNFAQTSDAEVRQLLAEAARDRAYAPAPASTRRSSTGELVSPRSN